MTLSTDLVILDPINPRTVFDFVLAMVAEGFHREPTWDHTRKGEGERHPASTSHYATTCGQGLPAWLSVLHADDGPLSYADAPDHCVRINWDTAYGFRGQNGEHCGDLHARYVVTVGRWLDEQGKGWWWHDECRGEWHERFDCIHLLGDPEGVTA